MILRRFMRHVSDQNWFAVGLDVLVVITGIFLGMQVTEWNEERQERIEEKDYLSRLIGDMENSLINQNEQIDIMTNYGDKLEIVVSSFLNGVIKPEEKKDFDLAMYMGGTVGFPSTNLGTIEELISSGKLGLISNPNIRALLHEIKQKHENLKGAVDVAKSINTSVMHLGVPYLIFKTKTDEDFPFEDVPTYNFEEMARDKKKLGAWSLFKVNNNYLIGQFEAHNTFIEGVILQFNEELQRLEG